MLPVRTTFEGAVVRLCLARPEARNALTAEMCDSIVTALEGVERMSDARVLVVEGEGKVFCAGADLGAVSGPGALEFLPSFEGMLQKLARFRLPTIARIQGAALGGGFQLATVCDFRVTEASAKLGIPSTRLGIVVNLENVERLVVLAGVALSKEIMMAGRILHGEEAVRLGLVTSSHNAIELDVGVKELAERIAGLAPLSVQGAKRTIVAVQDHLGSVRRHDPEEAIEVERLVVEAYKSSDLSEGLTAMAEKREPRFRGS